MMRQLLLMMLAVMFIIAAGCSGADALSAPRDENAGATAATANHHLWGLWQFAADPPKTSMSS